ncbi:MAG: hypothetical protein PHG19_06715, partial [Anaerotignum sp.]|nr:hypothetical protein [Anaerotignum sp.]
GCNQDRNSHTWYHILYLLATEHRTGYSRRNGIPGASVVILLCSRLVHLLLFSTFPPTNKLVFINPPYSTIA